MSETTPKEKDLFPPGLKRINFEEGHFEANGKTYFIDSKLSAGRFCEYQILQKEMGMGMSLQKMGEELSKLYQLLNKQRFVDASVVLSNMISGMVALESKEPFVLKLCTLFANTKDEDLTTWDNDLMTRKIQDWKKGGIAMDDFFSLAFATAPGYIELYNKLTQNITGGINQVVDAIIKS